MNRHKTNNRFTKPGKAKALVMRRARFDLAVLNAAIANALRRDHSLTWVEWANAQQAFVRAVRLARGLRRHSSGQ